MPSVLLERKSPIRRDMIPEGTFRAPYRIEQLQPRDIDSFRRVMHSGIKSLPFTDSDAITKRTPEYYLSALGNLFTNGGEWTLLAAKDEQGALAGVLEARITPDRQAGCVYWVCTDPDKQKQGVARALYAEYESRLRESGIPYILAGIHDTNEASLNFHRVYGFNMDTLYSRQEEKQTGWYFKEV